MRYFQGIRLRSQRGYTLAEIMVVLSVIGLISAITLPAFSGYLRRTRAAGIRHQLVADLYYARSCAITNRRTVAMHFLPDQYQIVDTTNNRVLRTTGAPRGVKFAVTADPSFYAWGLSDAVDITLLGKETTHVSLLPTGMIDHE